MSHYRTILVHLPDEARAARILSVAIDLAIAHDAHLTGLFVMPSQAISPAFAVARGLAETGRHALRESAKSIESIFEAIDAGLQLKKEWRFVEPGRKSMRETFIAHARTADLVIVPQRNPQWDESLLLEFPEDIIMTSGRPTLLVPNAGVVRPMGKRITIAWNDSREAARATFDSLPLLKRADNVTLVWVNPEDEALSPEEIPTAEIASTLARHGVRCTATEARGSDVNVGAELLRQMRQDQSDLLVMGAYGHSRFREMVFGGATRDTFRDMQVPVLFAH